MKAKQIMFLAILMIVAATEQASLGQNSRGEASDRMRYKKLTQELKSVDAEYNKALKLAVLETKTKGEASLEIKSRLLSLADKRERQVNRVTLLALRHGWTIPGNEEPKEDSGKVSGTQCLVFASADRMIKERLAQDSKRIVSRIMKALPLVSIQAGQTTKKRK